MKTPLNETGQIFGHLLLDFLNELLHKEEGKIVSLSYLKTERLGISETSRKAVFDLTPEEYRAYIDRLNSY